MFCIDLWEFSIDPLCFGYNFVELAIPVLCILTFQGPFGTQIDQVFFGCSYFYLRINLRWRSMRGGHHGPNETRWHVPHLWLRHLRMFGPWTLMPSVSVLEFSVWPKKFYRKTPRDVLMRRRQRNMKPRNRGCSSKDWRGKHSQSHLRSLLQPLQHHQYRQHDEEGVVYLWTMGLW
jgi:hypothetical protein